MNLVITGKIVFKGKHRPRAEVVETLHMLGHMVWDEVYPGIDYVVCSSQDFKSRKGIKLARADKFQIKSITLDDLFEILEIKL